MDSGADRASNEGVRSVLVDQPLPRDGEHCRAEEGCITCGDVALPLEVVEVDRAGGLALCRDEQGRRETVETALVTPVAAGETLLVHAGTALAKLDAEPGTPGREAEDVRA